MNCVKTKCCGGGESWYQSGDEAANIARGDNIDDEILKEELEVVREGVPKGWRGALHRVIESKVVQMVLVVLLIVDAAIVVTEIYMDYKALKQNYDEKEHSLLQLTTAVTNRFSAELNDYHGHDVSVLLKLINHNASSGANYTLAPADLDSPGHHRRRRGTAAVANDPHKSSYSTDHNVTKSGVTSDPHADTGDGDHSRGGYIVGAGHHGGDHGHNIYMTIGHSLHYSSIGILAVFELDVIGRVVIQGRAFCSSKFQVIDAFIITASLVIDVSLMFMQFNENVMIITIVCLIWRILRVVNSLMVTEEKRQHFRLQLQKRMRKSAEMKVDDLQESIEESQLEMDDLKKLCEKLGASSQSIMLCRINSKNFKRQSTKKKKINTSKGLTSVASMSVGFMSVGASQGQGQSKKPGMANGNNNKHSTSNGDVLGRHESTPVISTIKESDETTPANTTNPTAATNSPLYKRERKISKSSTAPSLGGDEIDTQIMNDCSSDEDDRTDQQKDDPPQKKVSMYLDSDNEEDEDPTLTESRLLLDQLPGSGSDGKDPGAEPDRASLSSEDSYLTLRTHDMERLYQNRMSAAAADDRYDFYKDSDSVYLDVEEGPPSLVAQ